MIGKVIAGIVVVVTLVALISGIFIVNEGEQVIITRFGKPVGGVKYAGAHLKMPLIEEIHRFDRKILKWDGDPNQITTKEKKFIWIDTTARWKIKDPLKFYTTVTTIAGGQSRLDDIIDSVVRDAVSGNYLIDLVRGDDYKLAPLEVAAEENDAKRVKVTRNQILADILQKAVQNTPDYGIELIDVQIKRLNYVPAVRERVYERMISERRKVASEYRSEGEGTKAEILGRMEKELKRIQSEAFRETEEIKGKADATAAKIYAEAYGKDPEFYAFNRSMESLIKTLGENTKMLISMDSAFYKYMQNPYGNKK